MMLLFGWPLSQLPAKRPMKQGLSLLLLLLASDSALQGGVLHGVQGEQCDPSHQLPGGPSPDCNAPTMHDTSLDMKPRTSRLLAAAAVNPYDYCLSSTPNPTCYPCLQDPTSCIVSTP